MFGENSGDGWTLGQIAGAIGAFISGLLGGHFHGKARAARREFDDEARDFIRETVAHEVTNSPQWEYLNRRMEAAELVQAENHRTVLRELRTLRREFRESEGG